jgi:hypothetical protein
VQAGGAAAHSSIHHRQGPAHKQAAPPPPAAGPPPNALQQPGRVSSPRAPPPPRLSDAELSRQPELNDIEAAIDCILSASRELWFADSYHLLPQRTRGRTTVVQDCYDPHEEVPLVAKFFAAHDDFASYMATSNLRANAVVMPSRHRAFANDEALYRSPDGFVFPPFIMLERGVPLGAWRTAPHTVKDVAGMLFDVANHLMSLHSQGRVHARLSAENVVWCAASGAWRLLKVENSVPAGARLCP